MMTILMPQNLSQLFFCFIPITLWHLGEVETPDVIHRHCYFLQMILISSSYFLDIRIGRDIVWVEIHEVTHLYRPVMNVLSHRFTDFFVDLKCFYDVTSGH